MAILLALGAAVCFAFTYVFQQREVARSLNADGPLGSRVHQLLTDRLFLGAWGLQIVGIGLQTAALGLGAMTVIAPLNATTIVFVLPLEARVTKVRITAREWLAAAAVVAGLGAFVALSSAKHTNPDVPAHHWGITIAATAVCTLAALGVARYTTGPLRTAAWASAAGVMWGLTAAFQKEIATAASGGFGAMVTSVALYAAIGSGLAGGICNTMAFKYGPLSAALSPNLVVTAISGALIGTMLYGESAAPTVGYLVAVVAAAGVAMAGVVVLARGTASRTEAAAPAVPLAGS